MKRFFLGILLAGVTVLLIGHVSQAASVNDFTIRSYEIDYYLGSDGSGRATLKTVEKITADFAKTNQNHGLERAIPTSYDGHPTHVQVQSVTDNNGKKLTYTVNDSNGNTVLRIGDKNVYVHGLTTYVITYTQRDVTRYFADTGKDEFYWDTNGTDWAVPIEQLTVRVHLDHSILPTFTKQTACYQGAMDATDRCYVTQDGDVLSTTVTNLQPHQNVTISLGFTAGTFIGYTQTPLMKLWSQLVSIWLVSLIFTSAVGVGCIVWLTRRYSRATDRRSELGTIVPEYVPPTGASVLVAAHIEGNPAKVLTAELLDLAVRGYIKIYQTRRKSAFRGAEYELELVKMIEDLPAEERALLTALFRNTVIGERFAMKSLRESYTISQQINRVLTTNVTSDIKIVYHLRQKDPVMSRWFGRFGVALLIVGIVTVSPLLLIAMIVAFYCRTSLWPLSETGLQLRRYLLGLKLYISVAEKDRLAMLQSPEGAEKIGATVDVSDAGQLVKLYERLLPYAVLFGQEKQWNKQLGAHYETTGTQPDWYTGTSAFNAAAFGMAMSSFNGVAASYAAASSSTTSGLGGGGFSGGGGGGGGGGGW